MGEQAIRVRNGPNTDRLAHLYSPQALDHTKLLSLWQHSTFNMDSQTRQATLLAQHLGDIVKYRLKNHRDPGCLPEILPISDPELRKNVLN